MSDAGDGGSRAPASEGGGEAVQSARGGPGSASAWERAAPSSRSGPPASVIAAALGAVDAEERRQAASRLGDLELREALPLVMRALGDADWRVRKEATFACQRLIQGTPVDLDPSSRPSGARTSAQVLVDALLEALRSSEDIGLRNAAIEVLGHCGGEATPALTAALDELGAAEVPDVEARKLVVEALGRTRDRKALDALERALAGADTNVRQASIEAIAAMGLIARERVTPILHRSLRDRDRFVQLTALHGLNALEAPVPWEVLAPLIDDSMLRSAALVAAALAESPEAPEALVSALVSARGSAFSQLVRALARLAEGPLADHVAVALRGSPPEVGVRLVQGTFAVPGVVAGMSEPPSWRGPGADPLSGRAHALVLAAIARAPGAADAAVQAMVEPALVEPAQRALSLLGPRAISAVLAYLGRHIDPEPDIWEGVDDATAALLDAAVAIVQEHLAALAEDGDPRTSDEALREPPWADLIAALRKGVQKSPSTLVATSALYGLAKVGGPRDLELAAAQTRSASLPVARAAEGALASLAERHPEAARALGRRMMHSEATYLPAAIVLEALGAPRDEGQGNGPNPTPVRQDELVFLKNAASAGDVRARRAAVSAVAAMGGPGALDVLSLALADEEREVRLAAARALGRLTALAAQAAMSSTQEPAPEPSPAQERARELLELVRNAGDPDLLAAAAQGGAALLGERASRTGEAPSSSTPSTYSPTSAGVPPSWKIP